jgi:hypothetical protein
VLNALTEHDFQDAVKHLKMVEALGTVHTRGRDVEVDGG